MSTITQILWTDVQSASRTVINDNFNNLNTDKADKVVWLQQFASTTSTQLAWVISDKTGTWVLVFATSPTLITPLLGTPTSWTLTNCTGLPLAWVVDSTTEALGVGTLEVWHATDTTISRVSAGKLAVEGVNIGNEGILQNSKSANYTTVLLDAGKHILHPTADNNARTFTIDSNANVAYPIGTAITFINQINTVTIAITSDTMTLLWAWTTWSRTLAANWIATAIKIASTSWVISWINLT